VQNGDLPIDLDLPKKSRANDSIEAADSEMEKYVIGDSDHLKIFKKGFKSFKFIN
jgi:hypothetical protein